MSPKDKGALQSDDVISQFRIVQYGSLQYLYLHPRLHCKLLLVFDDFKSDMLLLFVVVCLENFTKRPSAKHSHDLIFICNRITHSHFCIALWISEILKSMHSTRTNIVYFILLGFFSLKRRQFFLHNASRWFLGQSRLSFRQFLTNPNSFILCSKVVIALGRDFLAIPTTANQNFIDTVLIDWVGGCLWDLHWGDITFYVLILLVLVRFRVMLLRLKESFDFRSSSESLKLSN